MGEQRHVHERAKSWADYLPPRALPDTGPKELREGQVWATHIDGVNSKPIVWRVGSLVHSDWHRVVYLAGIPICLASGFTWFVRHAVLVADVGCEPVGPDVLYGPADEVTEVRAVMVRPDQVIVEGLETKAPPLKLTLRGLTDAVRDIQRRAAEPGPGIAALTLPPARPEPWRPSCDELHWVPDEREGWQK